MKVSEIREMSDDQLVAELNETRRQLFDLRFQAATERLDVPSELKKLRKKIARILTVQSERQKAGAEA
ncbi:MAG: 50S ribosomal protein L29 [Planctomycetaceae bacterium]|nr:50S ribosomal protein L29 [Planctomycetaceae bacterium]